MPVVLEGKRRFLQHASPLYVDRVVGIHQDVAYGVILQERFQRPQPEDLVQHLLRKAVPLRSAQRNALLIDDLLDYDEELMLERLRLLQVSQFVQVDPLDQLSVNGRLDVLLNTVRDRAGRACGALSGSRWNRRNGVCVRHGSQYPGSSNKNRSTSTVRIPPSSGQLLPGSQGDLPKCSPTSRTAVRTRSFAASG